MRMPLWFLCALVCAGGALGCVGSLEPEGSAALAGAESGVLVRKTPPLSTPWTEEGWRAVPLPEYPRPQLVRTDWQTLNGEWEFETASAGQSPPTGRTLAERVQVPFAVEAALSGIQRRVERMWYRRAFSVPAGWAGRRVQLHFGAVDFEATVYVNGARVGSHRGGFDAFSFDVTGQLRQGANELIVGVFDPGNAGDQPVGKQSNNPGGIWYTPASGIWQTVWLEPTPAAHVTGIDAIPDVPGGRLRVTVRGAGIAGESVEVVARRQGAEVGRATGAVGAELSVPVPAPRLWSPEDPFLYDLDVRLLRGGATVDSVRSYFGMRSVGVKMVGGVLRPVLNGRFVFQLGTLDQGYWPDGIYTAPSDAALRFDIEKHKELGFNMIRKHVKVEPQRWYHWADRLGILVWQDMPTMNANPSAAARTQYELELRELIDEHRSSPAIVAWVPGNEGWGQYDPAHVANLTRSWDPSRLVDNMSGINCCGSRDGGNGDFADWHVYPGPAAPPALGRTSALGEFGGIGLRVAGHEWSPGNGFGYVMVDSPAALTSRYLGMVEDTQSLMAFPGLSVSVYTEITDVENEINGLLTYDRAVMKVDAAQVRAAHAELLDVSRALNDAAALPLNQEISLRVMTPGYTNRLVRHADSLAFTEVVTPASSDLLKLDATFKVVPGLASAACYSFESKNFPGRFLRHAGFRVRSDARDGSALFDADATFCAREALDGSGHVSLESFNMAGHYLRHRSAEVWVDALQQSAGFRQDASWSIALPAWRSSVSLPRGELRSLQALTPGFGDRSIRHRDDLTYTEVVNAASSELLRLDATFRVVAGLADASCYSFESRNFPGHFLRHQDFRVRKGVRDGSPLFDQDATFCARAGLSGAGISLESLNVPGHYLRHRAAEIWIDGYPGTDLFRRDASWSLIAPWAP